VRIASFRHRGRPSYGVVRAGGIVDAGRKLGVELPDLRSVLAADAIDELHALAADAEPDLALAEVELLPVITHPDKILCVGINYRPHVEETGRDAPEHPVLFTRFPGSQVGHGRPLVRPSVSHRFDYEGELAVIIGRRGRHIAPEGALRHVAGYSCFNDGSVRDFQRHSSQFTAGKNFARSGGFGPWLTTADEIGDPARLTLETRLNGAVMQSADVADLIFDVPALIGYCSTFAELLPGDVIVTGTPGGVGYVRKPPVYLQPGDVVEVDIPGVGVLRNGVVDEVDVLSGREPD
jgi:2-keto-4-pentenoate hydratase/2-oxohepta-3-ene-1,7-dioic acid hydratase in catechol pathway